MSDKYIQAHTHRHTSFLTGVHVLLKYEKAAKLRLYFHSYRENSRRENVGP